jgi:hypothetical protein
VQNKEWESILFEVRRGESLMVVTGSFSCFLCMFLEVFLHVVEKLEEVRGFSCIKASDGRVILVWMIFADELSVMDLDFSLRCSKSESKNRK